MIYSLSGKLIVKKPQFIAIKTNGIGFKIFTLSKPIKPLKIGSRISVFCSVQVRQDGIDLYGFLTEKELEIFELFISADGIGPKAALKILEMAKIDSLLAAIKQGRSDLFTRVSGIGEKKAQRLILELKDKIKHYKSEEEVAMMETDGDIEKALKNLGYKKTETTEAIKHISPQIEKMEERLRAALKFLSK